MSSGATACVRAALCPAPDPIGSPARTRRLRFVARHGLGEAEADPLAQPLVAREEERLVGDNRPANRAAELVQLQRLLDVVVLARRIQRIVAPVLEDGAGESIAAALADDRDVAAGAEPAFRRREAGVHAEFRHRLHRRLQPELRPGGVQVARARVPDVGAVHAVVVQVVLLVRLAVEPHRGPAAVAVARGAGGERHQVGEVAAVDRQVLHFLRRDVDADPGGRQVQHRGGGDHVHLFGKRGDAQLDLDGLDLRDAQDDVAGLGLEARELDLDDVRPGGEVGHDIGAVTFGDDRADAAVGLRRDGDRHAGQRTLALVEHLAKNS